MIALRVVADHLEVLRRILRALDAHDDLRDGMFYIR